MHPKSSVHLKGFLLTLLLCPGLTFSAFSAKNSYLIQQDSTQFDYHFNKGKTDSRSNQPESAILSFKEAMKYAKDPLRKAHVVGEIGWVFYFENNSDSAIYYADQALAFMAEFPDSLDNSMKSAAASTYRLNRVINYDLGNYEEAHEASLNEKRIIENDSLMQNGLSKVYMNMSIEKWSLYEYEEAIIYSNKSLQMANLLDSKDREKRPRQLRAYMMLGLLFGDMGRSEMAIENHELALQIIGDDRQQNAFDHMATSANIGDVFYGRQQYEEAILRYNEAIESIELIPRHPNYGYYKAEILQKLGGLYTKLRMFDKSKLSFDQAWTILDVAVPPGHPARGSLLNSIGINAALAGEFSEAIQYLSESLKVYKAAFGNTNPSLCEVYNNLGQTYEEHQQFEKAMVYFDSALMNNPTLTIGSKLIYENPNAAIVSSMNKVLILKHLNLSNSEMAKRLKSIYAKIIHQANMSFIRGEDVSTEVVLLFEILFSEALLLNQKVESAELSRILWEITEYDKSRKLISHLNEQVAFQKLIPKEIQQQQQAVKDSIQSFFKTKSDSRPQNDSVLVVLNNTYDQMIRTIEKSFPDYHKLKFNHEVVEVNQIQNNLGDNEIVIEYYHSDSSLYATVISKQEFSVEKLPIDSAFEVSRATFERSLRTPGPIVQSRDYIISASELYDYLIKPLEQRIGSKDIVIVPSSYLTLIPFEALLTKAVDLNSNSNYQQLPYIIKDRAVSYANSITLLNQINERSTNKNNGKMLAISPTFSTQMASEGSMVERNNYAPLKYALIEIEKVSFHYGSTSLLREEATETAFRKIAKDYSIIHIASHGVVSDVDPLYSKIVLSSEKTDSLNDGFLYTYELFNTSLNAEMAVLSACNTGFGEIQRGEGVMSLAQGFFYAGVQSTIMSLWTANDQSTSEIMSEFYANLKNGGTKHASLRQAKLTYLDQSDNITGHPFYWAQFVANGNMRPIKQTSGWQYYWYAFMALILVGSIIKFLNRPRKAK